LGQRPRRAAGRHELRRSLLLVDELQDDEIGRGAGRGERDGLAVGVADRLDAALRPRIQNASGPPVASPQMIFTGMPLAKGLITPSVPLVMAMSIEPDTTGIRVEAPPSV